MGSGWTSTGFRVLLVAGLLGPAGCSFLLDFDESVADEDAAVEDAGEADAGIDAMPAPDAIAAVNCAVAEPNETLETAVLITPGNLDAGYCPDDDADFYRFTLPVDSDLRLTLSFATEVADLNMQLMDSDGIVIVLAAGSESPEVISRTLAGANQLSAGDYVVQVGRVEGTEDVDYTLGLEITTP